MGIYCYLFKKAMPKKKVVKKKKKVKTEDDDEEKIALEIPDYEDPELYAPRARLKIELAAPISSKLAFTAEMMLTDRVEDIRQLIIDKYDGSVSDITMCLNSYEKCNILDPQKDLQSQGITADTDQKIIYDF